MVILWKSRFWQFLLMLSSMLWASSGCAIPLTNTSPQQTLMPIAQVSRQKLTDKGNIRIVHVPPRNKAFAQVSQALQDSLEFSASQDTDGLITRVDSL